MPVLTDVPPPLSSEVLVCPADETGVRVVKHRGKRKYVRLGEQESFLLLKLDGKTTYAAIVASFEDTFREQITCNEVADFVALAKNEGLIERTNNRSSEEATPQPAARPGVLGFVERCIKQARKQSLLYFRISMFDPDRALNWLEPKTRWLFSTQLAVAAAIAGIMAMFTVWVQRAQLINMFSGQLGWETFVLAWATAMGVTVCHEFGHGLACKRYGGEVREMGLLWLFFTPCLYCNVSDAWLFSKRSQRLIVSMAGTYVDFLIWIVAVFLWRVTTPDTAFNFMMWIVVTTCGVRVAFNINPLMRLDGYYALADLMGVHNLRRRGRARWMEYVRWMLWGAEKPQPIDQGGRLFYYGVISWFFTVAFLSVLFFNLAGWLNNVLGMAGVIGAAGVFVQISKRYFRGSLGEDFKKMFSARRARAGVLGVVVIGALFVPVYDWAGGPFHLRPVVRWEVRAPVAGFLRAVETNEGKHVSAQSVVLRLETPELTSQITRKEAEIRETEANLRRLNAGTRPEAIADQQEKVTRAVAWRDLAKRDLQRAESTFNEEIARLDLAITQANTELEYRNTIYQQAQQLYAKGGLAGQQLLSHKKKSMEAEAALHTSQAAKRGRQAEGVMKFEGELARREKELADARAALSLLQAGSRPEDIAAEAAKLERLQEELAHLHHIHGKQAVTCPVAGTITTPRMHEKIGQYFERGALICVVEDLENLEAEIAVSEQDARVLIPGQPVTLRPRALPFDKVTGQVDRVAAAALTPEKTTQSTVTVICQFDNESGKLRTGMTGYGRVTYGVRPLGLVALHATMRFLRTEFWW